jgi:PAS domain S-box-containing protein
MTQFTTTTRTKKELLLLLNAYQQAIDFNIICSITDLKGTILFVNKKFCEYAKYTEEQLLGQNHRMLNSSFHPRGFFKQMWKTIGRGGTWTGEVKNKASDGTFYWVETVVLPIRDRNQKIIQYLSLRMPIDDRKNAEMEKQEYLKALEEMLFMTSHEVRKPLTSCMGLMNLVEDGKPLSQLELWNTVKHLKSSALELDVFTKKLTIFMYEMEQKTKRKIWT